MNSYNASVYEINQKLLDEYTTIPIKFTSDSIYELVPVKQGLDGVEIVEVKVDSFEKDYDSEESNPSHLLKKFDLTNWRVVSIYDKDTMVAGAIIAYNTIGINMLESKNDLAVLWDIRVHPDYRGQGLGTRLVEEVKIWAKSNNCNRLKIETQNINVNACNFYASQGATLSGYNRFYYNENPSEIQFIWSIEL